MKLLSFLVDGQSRVGCVTMGGVVDLTARTGISSLRALLERLDDVKVHMTAPPDCHLDDLHFLPPIQDPARILCVGLNYLSHVTEGEHRDREPPQNPNIFLRLPSSQVGHLQPIVRPKISDCLDFEGELAVVIGKSCRYVSQAEAMSVIAGYACYNDGSIRDWQQKAVQNAAGKNFPATGAFGPFLVTRDEVPEIRASSLVTRVNGSEMQRAIIGQMLFGIPRLVEYCSSFTDLAPGDVIVTGTAGGAGVSRTPPLWLKPGDIVEVEIQGVGILQNLVVDEIALPRQTSLS